MAHSRLKLLRELHRQLAMSPPDVRRGHMDRLERLLSDFDTERVYPYEYIYFRVTGFRPTEDFRETYAGSELLPELQWILEDLSRRVPRDAEATGEEVLTVKEAAAEAGVSVRTVQRWRRRGLVCRTYRFPDGSVQRGIRRSSLERFFRANPELAEGARRFERMNRTEQRRALKRARALAERGLGVTETARRVAGELGRATETVRRTIRRHDEDHPSEAVFAEDRTEDADAERMLTLFREGVSADDLAERFGLSRQSIYRIVNTARAERLLREPLEAFEEDEFDAPDADETILGADYGAARELLEGQAEPTGRTRGERWWESPLTPEAERRLWRAYNYLKARANRLLEEVNPNRYVPSRLLDEIESRRGRARDLHDALVRAHLPLVDHVAWQHAGRRSPADALVTRGRRTLSDLVQAFDYRKGGRFPSYATLELLKRFARD